MPIFWLRMMMQLLFLGRYNGFHYREYAGISSLDAQLIHTTGFLLFDSLLSGE